jgi:sporulation protein YlmC with PRC-barrel domain
MASMNDVVDIGCARVEEAPDITDIVNCAYQGGDGLTVGWTGVAHLLGGLRVTVDQVAAWIVENPQAMLVVRQSGQLIGSVHLTNVRPDVGEISLLAIRPSRQDGGLGRLLTGCGRASPGESLELPYRRVSGAIASARA